MSPHSQDEVKLTPLSHATIWRHKVRADDSSWFGEEDCASEEQLLRLDIQRGTIIDSSNKSGARTTTTTDSPSKHSSHYISSQLTTLNLSNNSFAAVPVGLPCLAPKLTKLNLSKNEIVEVGAINSFPSSIKHLDLSGNQLESWPIPISETVREDEAYHCFGLNVAAAAAATASLQRLAAADCDAAFSGAIRQSPDGGQVRDGCWTGERRVLDKGVG